MSILKTGVTKSNLIYQKDNSMSISKQEIKPNLISGCFRCYSTKNSYTSYGSFSCHVDSTLLKNNIGKTLCFSYYTSSIGSGQFTGSSWQDRFGIHGACQIDGTQYYPLADLLEYNKTKGVYYCTWTIPSGTTFTNLSFSVQTNYNDGFAHPSDNNNETWFIENVKLEWNTKPTLFCPSEYDNITFNTKNNEIDIFNNFIEY